MFDYCRACEPHLAAAAEELDLDAEIVEECPSCQSGAVEA